MREGLEIENERIKELLKKELNELRVEEKIDGTDHITGLKEVISISKKTMDLIIYEKEQNKYDLAIASYKKEKIANCSESLLD